ncbi:alpha-L-fucosidase [Butyrivibrio sp.]|jgi:alpha-L-fucosidase|uniref:alpha-L-fucosidase n=1 Tax=Butyrivibrio sp. TaxID=28121 RepID=UPI0025BE72E8|nr:alpha-L-fucosidase [Butyrivibrio sp.]MBQ9306134.1 alpha-L-fucosidase [Butyrivibrio sp.]
MTYTADWDSLSNYRVPQWYSDARFGIFIHFGIYSVPAYANEWYSRNMYIQGTREFEHHVKTYGPHKDFGYKDFIPMFKAEKFNADEWADLFQKAGAKYVVPVAEHHDGFQMYKSKISKWNAYEMGPKIDYLGELKKSVEKKGMRLGASSHRIEHWFFMSHGRDFESDINDSITKDSLYWPAMKEPEDHYDLYAEPTPTKEFMEDWLLRTKEIIDNYHPEVLYFDWWIQEACLKPYLREMAAYYYNEMEKIGKVGVINYKHDAFPFGVAVPDVERGQMALAQPFIWQTDTAIGRRSWCYTIDNEYKDSEEIVCNLIDAVAKNGNMLLNVGPKPDGTISDEDKKTLLGIGKWLSENGEAIYNSKPYRVAEEGPTKMAGGQFTDKQKINYTPEDIRFTVAHGNIYVHVLKCADNGEYIVKSLGTQKDAASSTGFSGIIRGIKVLANDSPVTFERKDDGLHLKTDYKSEMPVVFKIEML